MTTTVTAFDRIIDKLRDLGHVTVNGDKARAKCPAHNGQTDTSLAVEPRRDSKGAVVFCHAGCQTADVLAALNLAMTDLFDDEPMRAAYNGHNTYTYPGGREVHRKAGKNFWQGGNKTDNSLFHADRIGDTETVYVVEGEKDVLAVESVGGVAVCSAMGAGKAHKFDWTPLNGKTVIIVADNDTPGHPHAADIAALLDGIAESVTIKQAKVGKDTADHIAAGLSLDELVESESQPKQSALPVALTDALAVFKRWLHLDDTAPVIAVAATIVANLAEGEAVWFLLVGPPSGGKTEILTACMKADYITAASTITEAALLSGTAKRDRAKTATGGLMRQIGDFGILLTKDFTSVLSQNMDTAKQAMSALREVFDGRWDRPVGSEGARVLHWEGKCGFLGGVTPSYDRYGSVVNALGDRYLLLRMPDVDAPQQAKAALKAAHHEKAMRAELSTAMLGLIASADPARAQTDLTDDEAERLVSLAIYTATARTAVERNSYTGELLVIPQPEGPARLVKAMRQLHGAMGALGVDDDTRWEVLTRMAVDCAPAIRTPLLLALLAQPDTWLRTVEVAASAEMVAKTAYRHLEDLALLGMAEHRKQPKKERTEAADGEPDSPDNAPHQWKASGWLLEHWPRTAVQAGQKTTTDRVASKENGVSDAETTPSENVETSHYTGSRRFLSSSGGDPEHLFDEPSSDGETRQCECGNELNSPESQRAGKCKPCRDELMAGYDQ